VDAAGAWADEVAALAGVPTVGLQPLRRTLFTSPVTWPDPIDGWPIVIDAAERLYFKPEAGQQLLVSPADETPMPPCDVQHEVEDVALALEMVNARTTLGLRSVRAAWAGLRTFAPDRTPVAGSTPEHPGFVWLAGQGGYGIQLAPALARTTAALALGRALPADVAAEGGTAEWLAPGRLMG
jgi:D-arginine dehydrogenase